VMVVAIAMATVFFTAVGADSAALGASPTSLLLPQSTAFSVLGHSCGGIQEQALATGFDATNGYPIGDIYLQTRCGGSGRGGGYHTTTYSAWVGVMWDYTGAVVAFEVLAGAPTNVDPTFSAIDAFGNEVYNQLNAVNVTPANCAVGNTTSCSYRAYLVLSTDFVSPPRVTTVSVTSGPTVGGTNVTITGTGFTGATAVTFGATPAPSFAVSGDTSITAVSPATSAGTVDVTVTTAGGTSAASAADQFTFIAAPAVSGLSPDSGTVDGGTLVTITGANFIEVSGVNFGESPAGFTVNDDSSITAVSPAGEATDTVHVTVETIGGTSARTAADKFTYTASIPAAVCGDGNLDPGEQCDDGAANGMPGDCCSVTCAFQPAGTTCADDGSLCTSDLCDAAGSCIHPIAPSPACTPPDVTMGASLLMRTLAGRNSAQFRWGKGTVVPLAAFGDPTGDEVLQLCIYDQTGPDTYTLALTGSPSVSSGGVWTARAMGWTFRSRTGAPDGITHVSLTAGTIPLNARVRVQARNSPAFAPLPLLQNPSVVAQLKTSSGACWGATFSTPTVNTAAQFEAKSD